MTATAVPAEGTVTYLFSQPGSPSDTLDAADDAIGAGGSRPSGPPARQGRRRLSSRWADHRQRETKRGQPSKYSCSLSASNHKWTPSLN